MTREQDLQKNKSVDPLRTAIDNWGAYSTAAENLVHLTHEGLSRTLDQPELFRILEMDDGQIKHAEWKADMARVEVESGFATLHAHSLLGLYGAMECFIEDIFIARIGAEPDLLAGASFAKVKLPVAVLSVGDERDRLVAIMTETSRALNADVGVGATKFERLLAAVELGGPIPAAVRNALYLAQQIRNVWAHRGGVADKRFVDACPQLEYEVGDRVNMTQEVFLPLMHGLHMYSIVVINRYLVMTGRERVSVECPGYEGCLLEIDGAS